MIKRPDTNAQRLERHKRVRAKLSGTSERPRLNVFRREEHLRAGHRRCGKQHSRLRFTSG